jgi:hypothetical protein
MDTVGSAAGLRTDYRKRFHFVVRDISATGARTFEDPIRIPVIDLPVPTALENTVRLHNDRALNGRTLAYPPGTTIVLFNGINDESQLVPLQMADSFVSLSSHTKKKNIPQNQPPLYPLSPTRPR